MQIGLLGKANVGKSTFFSAATGTSVPVGNFPFTTIKPNVGVAHVRTECPCRSLGVKHENPLCMGGRRFVPVKLVDIAGLVPDAHLGRGLGIQFLDDSRQADVLIHVVDIAGATDIQGQPVPPGTHDPGEDIGFVAREFEEWFAQVMLRDWARITKETEQRSRGISEGIAKRLSGLGVSEQQVRDAMQETGLGAKKPSGWTEEESRKLAALLCQKAKPVVLAANKADICRDIPRTAGKAIPCSAESEAILSKASAAGVVKYIPGDAEFDIMDSASPKQREALGMIRDIMKKLGGTGIQRAINNAVLDALGYIVVYPVEDEGRLANKDGEVLPDAKLVPRGSTARDLAGLVHGDIAAGFLYAIDCRTKQRIGAEHELRDGDVIKIVSSARRG